MAKLYLFIIFSTNILKELSTYTDLVSQAIGNSEIWKCNVLSNGSRQEYEKGSDPDGKGPVSWSTGKGIEEVLKVCHCILSQGWQRTKVIGAR